MSKETLPESHASITACNDIREICKPLFDHSCISTFIFGRFFIDGSCYMLTTNEKWHEYHFEKQYAPTAPVPKKHIKDHFCYLIPEEGRYLQAAHDARSLFNISRPIDIIDMGDGYYDMYCFAADEHQEGAENFYFNNIDLLENFILYFKAKADKLLVEAASNKLFLSEKMRPELLENCRSYKLETQSLPFKIQRYPITANEKTLFLSIREFQVLYHLSKGKSNQQIGSQLLLSPRIIESYLENTKKKLNCYTKSQAIDLFVESGLDKVK